MRRLLAICLFNLLGGMGLTGCALDGQLPSTSPPVPVTYANPTFLPTPDRDIIWRNLVDVVDDYFRIAREEPVRVADNVLTEGRLETVPLIASTAFEPWRGDSVRIYDKLEATLQTIRRTALVRMVPTTGGYLVYVTVFKELEDASRPSQATASAATFMQYTAIQQFDVPVIDQPIQAGWIPQGNDVALEQVIIGKLRTRLGL